VRVIDKERDYYDIGQGLGYDATVTYVRARKEIDHNGWYGNDIYVGFCGEIYHGLYLSHYYRFPSTRVVTPAYCYSIEDVDRWVDEHYDDKDKDWYYSKPGAKCRGGTMLRKEREGFFEKRGFEHYKALFAEHNAPIFVVDNSQRKVFINPLLRPYQFQKVKEPYIAYQEIEQYVGGVLLSPVSPIPEVPNDVMVEIKGFDPKWGFRKPPKDK